MDPTPSPRRPRGAQLRNHNAIKHGYYSRYFRAGELSDLAEIADNLDAEIAALRTYARRLMEVSDTDPDLHPLDALNGLGIAFIRIASLMRTRQLLSGGSSSDFDHALERAISAIQEEISCKT